MHIITSKQDRKKTTQAAVPAGFKNSSENISKFLSGCLIDISSQMVRLLQIYKHTLRCSVGTWLSFHLACAQMQLRHRHTRLFILGNSGVVWHQPRCMCGKQCEFVLCQSKHGERQRQCCSSVLTGF